MKLVDIVKKYIAYRKSFGGSMKEEEKCLMSLCRFMGKSAGITDISPQKIKKFLYTKKKITKSWLNKHSILKGFYCYLNSRGYCRSVPLPPRGKKVATNFIPYIYTRDELRKIFKLALIYKKEGEQKGHRGHLFPYMIRVFFVFLYSTGMRLSEALSLKMENINLQQKVVLVKESKFHKSRIVPFNSQLAFVLKKYFRWKREHGFSEESNMYIFSTLYGRPLSPTRLLQIFRRVCDMTNIKRHDNSIYQPRIHDLRHSFAVHCLTNWYRNNMDTQLLLPVLSTYLGHEGIAGTARYLTMTEELLKEANYRFEKYALRKTL